MSGSIYFAKAEGARPAPKLPSDAVTRTFGIFGVKDSGKTTTARVIAEGIVKLGGYVVPIDPVGVWWGITRAGEGPGLPGIVIGGEHADVPLEKTGGHLVAELVLARQYPVVVIDMKLLRKGEQVAFMADFCEEVYFRNRRPLHLIFEEADRALPQSPRGMDPTLGRLLGAAEDIVKLGRSRGLGATFLSQRMATVTKNVTEQVEALLLHAQIGPRDRKAVREWIESNGDPARTKVVMDSMASLGVGEGWLYSPKWLGVLERVRVKAPKTLDSSSTPSDDERDREEAAARAPVDLDELRRLMAETVERAAANDPRTLRARVEELEELLEAGGGVATEIAALLGLDEIPSPDDLVAMVREHVERPMQVLVPDRGQVVALTEAVASLDAAEDRFRDTLALAVDAARDAVAGVEAALSPVSVMVGELTGSLDVLAGRRVDEAPQPAPPNGHPAARVAAATAAASRRPTGRLSAGAERLLEDMRGVAPLRLRRSQLALILGRGAKSSTLTQQLGELKANGDIDGSDSSGWWVVGRDAPELSLDEQIRRWHRALPDGPRAIFNALVARHPRPWPSRDELFVAAGFSPTSSTPVTHLKLLRDNGLAGSVGAGREVGLGPALVGM